MGHIQRQLLIIRTGTCRNNYCIAVALVAIIIAMSVCSYVTIACDHEFIGNYDENDSSCMYKSNSSV